MNVAGAGNKHIWCYMQEIVLVMFHSCAYGDSPQLIL